MEYLMYYDKDTGRYVYPIYVDGKLCPYFFHDTKVSQQWAAYQVIGKDLANARGAFIELDQYHGHSPLIRLSLLFAGIMLYGKCYSEAKGRKTSLDNKAVLKNIGQEFSSTHEHLIDLRNQYVAHAGAGEYQQYPITVNLDPNINNKAIHGFMLNGIEQVHHERYLKQYISLLDKVIEYVSDVAYRVEMKLNRELSELNIDELYRASKMPEPEHFMPISGEVNPPKT